MSISVKPYGITSDGQPVDVITMERKSVTCTILTYGGAIETLIAPDRGGNPVDVVLGYDNMPAWERQTYYLNALVGRCGNRIAKGAFTLNGVDYTLAINNDPNSLHGGAVGYDRRIWTLQETGEHHIVLHLDSPHMEEGYPGNLSIDVTYTILEDGISIRYQATTDQTTLCNLTNHAYFNLAGHDSGDVAPQIIQTHCHYYTPGDETAIPTGEIAPVAGTPIDFTTPTAIGARADDDFDQLNYGTGYDINMMVDGEAGTLRPVMEAYSAATGILMSMETTTPSVQLYGGNFLTDTPVGKGGAVYGRRHGFCAESQFCPDAINHPNFIQPVLHPGDQYDETTTYRFSVK